MTKPFEIIQKDQAARTDVYCDHTYHITVHHPQHIHSGIPAKVTLGVCNCEEVKATPSDQIPASDLAIIHSDVAKARFGDEVPEATGDPELDNASLEGSEPEREVITSEDVEPPASHDEFEALGADAHAHGPVADKPKSKRK